MHVTNRYIFSSLILASLLSIQTGAAAAVKLEQVWQLDGLQNPESVVYDKQRQLYYVSNVNGAANVKDGKGSISTVSAEGKLIEPAWIVGLNAPKGMAIYNDKLYVADIDALLEIDIEAGLIENRYVVADAKFLNDVTVDDKGNVYVSDMVMNRVHRLQNDKFEIWLEGEALENPNGLHFEEDDIMLGSWGKMTNGFETDIPGHLKRISLKDKEISSVGDGSPLGNLDGVEGTEETGFYVTDWMNGKLFLISRKGKVTELMDLNAGSADLEYVPEKNLIVIPMMKDNTLNAYRISK